MMNQPVQKGFRGINPPRLKVASRFVLRSLDLIPDPLTCYPVLKLLFISRISRFRFLRPSGSLLYGLYPELPVAHFDADCTRFF